MISKEQALSLFIERDSIWLDNSVKIANCFPHVWEAIENQLARTHNMLNLRLADLLFDPFTEYVEYCIVEHGGAKEVRLKIPLRVMIEATNSEDPSIVEYLTSTPPTSVVDLTGSPDDIETRRTLEKALRHTQQQYPGMFIDIPRMVELEEQFKLGTVFKGETTDTKQ